MCRLRCCAILVFKERKEQRIAIYLRFDLLLDHRQDRLVPASKNMDTRSDSEDDDAGCEFDSKPFNIQIGSNLDLRTDMIGSGSVCYQRGHELGISHAPAPPASVQSTNSREYSKTTIQQVSRGFGNGAVVTRGIEFDRNFIEPSKCLP